MRFWRHVCWAISVVFFIAAVVAVVSFGLKLGGQGPAQWLAVMVTLELHTFVPAMVLIALIALIPAKGKHYWQRFWARAPFVLAVVTGLVLAINTMPFWYSALMGIRQLPDTDLKTVGTAPDQDCDRVRNGVFENSGMRIEREGDRQVQYDKVLRKTDTLVVSWTSACTYELHRSGTPEVMHVKITHVDAKGYDCVFDQPGMGRLVYSLRLDRVP